MAESLVLVADTDAPTDWATLPHDCGIVLGYVGQPLCTPHVWTEAEVQAARDHGLAWAPIHTPPGGPFGAAAGARAGALMVQELTRYKLFGTEPVFLDIEHASWAADPRAAMTGVRTWQSVMHDHGHPQAYAYLPWEARTGWGANWVSFRPTSLPDGYVGWQYDHSHPGRHYDLSVFRADVFAPLLDSMKGGPMALDHDAQAFIVAQLTKVQDNLHQILWAYYEDPAGPRQHPYANRHVIERLDHLQAEVAKLSIGPVDVATLAADLAAQLGPRLAADLATELANRLSH